MTIKRGETKNKMQESVRARLNKFLDETGVSQLHISEQTNIPTSLFSRFKTGKRNLNSESLIDLDKFLTNKLY